MKEIELRIQDSWEKCLRNGICLPSFGINLDLSLTHMIQEEIRRDNEISEGINDDIVEETILEINEIEVDEEKEE